MMEAKNKDYADRRRNFQEMTDEQFRHFVDRSLQQGDTHFRVLSAKLDTVSHKLDSLAVDVSPFAWFTRMVKKSPDAVVESTKKMSRVSKILYPIFALTAVMLAIFSDAASQWKAIFHRWFE